MGSNSTFRPTSHDRLFKQLLRSFFQDFVELVDERLAHLLDFSDIEFLEQEAWADMATQAPMIADLVARLRTRDGEGRLVLAHTEIERKFRRKTEERLFRCSLHLRLKYDLPVMTLVLYLKGGPPGVVRRHWVDQVASLETHRFTYYAFGLSRCDAREYLQRPQILAAALAALMARGTWNGAELHFNCMSRIAKADIDEARRFLLGHIVRTYVKMNSAERQQYEAALAQSREGQEVKIMERTWEEEIEARVIERDKASWIDQGMQRGRELGEVLGMQALLARLLERRFGHLPVLLQERLARLEDRAELERLSERILEARSLDDLGLDE